MTKVRNVKEPKASKKQLYVSPKLSCFGEVRHLTTGGSEMAIEGEGDKGTDKEVRT